MSILYVKWCKEWENHIYVDILVALKSLALSLCNTSPELVVDQNRLLPDLSYTLFSKLHYMILIAVRQYLNNLESSVVRQELELAIKVRKAAKIRNLYNQAPHLVQDTTWERDKNTIKHHKQEPRGQPFPSS